MTTTTNDIYQSLSPASRVWIYQANTTLNDAQTTAINSHLQQFARQWTAHNQALKAFAAVFHNRYIVLMVDETQAGASGCSIDKSVHFIQALEREYNIQLFDRMTFTYRDNNGIQAASREAFAVKYAQGTINDDTIVFDNLVKTKAEFESSWEKKLSESWHKRMV